jgi:hypothetical protein
MSDTETKTETKAEGEVMMPAKEVIARAKALVDMAKEEKRLEKKARNVLKLVPARKAKKAKAEGACTKCGKSKPKSKRSKFCSPCYKERRKLQLKRNNVAWHKRIEAGKAKHHLTYRGKPTEWALTHKSEAVKHAKRMLRRAEEKGQEGTVRLAEVALKVIPKAKAPDAK